MNEGDTITRAEIDPGCARIIRAIEMLGLDPERTAQEPLSFEFLPGGMVKVNYEGFVIIPASQVASAMAVYNSER